MTVDALLKSGVYLLLPPDHNCIKVRIYFWASECLLSYFLTPCYVRSVRPFYSSKPRAVWLPSFNLYK
jgi:hypothetical protein